MTERFLDGCESCALLKRMARVAVAQPMQRHVAGNGGSPGAGLHAPPDLRGAQEPAARGAEHRRVFRCLPLDLCPCGRTDADRPRVVASAEQAHEGPAVRCGFEASPFEAANLTDPSACRLAEPGQSPVACVGLLVDHAERFIFSQDAFGQVVGVLREGNQRRPVRLEVAQPERK